MVVLFQTNTLNCKVVKVYDGDTIVVNVSGIPEVFGKNIPVRIYGIDAPEIKSKNIREKRIAIEAKEYLECFLSEDITLINLKRDKYFRILADVKSTDGGKISEKMLDTGLVRGYNGEKKQPWDFTEKGE